MRTMICGYSGSGKSTLAGWLGRVQNCPVLYLDTVQFSSGWEERNRTEAEKMVQEFLETEKNWVMDGNYFGKFCWEQRIKEADRIFLLKFNPVSCLFRVAKRYFRYRGRTRESMAEGCMEKLDREFVWWVLKAGRSGKNGRYLEQIAKAYSGKTFVVRNQKELDLLYEKLKQERK